MRPHPVFRWVDDDLHVDVPLSVKQVRVLCSPGKCAAPTAGVHAPHKLCLGAKYATFLLLLVQCLLGGRVEVPTLDGQLELLVAPNTSPSTVKVLKGRGPVRMHHQGVHGDIIVHFQLNVSWHFPLSSAYET